MASILKFDKWQNTAGTAYGTVLQVVNATSGFTNQTITSATPVALSGMSVTITPFFSTSKILIFASISASWTYVSSLHLYKNGTDMIANHGSNSQLGGATALWTFFDQGITATDGASIFTLPMQYVDSPGTTSATTYALYANSGWLSTTYSLYFNNRAAGEMLSSSYICAMEIAQ